MEIYMLALSRQRDGRMEATRDGHEDDPAAIDGGGRRKRHYFELLALQSRLDAEMARAHLEFSSVVRQLIAQGIQIPILPDKEMEEKLEKLPPAERERHRAFQDFYSTCPTCNRPNVPHYLDKVYFSEDPAMRRLVGALLEIMQHARGIDDEMPAPIKIGIPCCRCFEKYSPGAFRQGP